MSDVSTTVSSSGLPSHSSKDLRQLNWQSKIVLEIGLHTVHVAADSPPDPLFVPVPRICTLASILPQIRDHVSNFTAIGGSDRAGSVGIWLEYDSAPIQWHLPIGSVLDGIAATRQHSNSSIVLVVRVGTPPSYVLPMLPEDLSSSRMAHSWKQAVCAAFGSSSALTNLPVESQGKFFAAASNGDFELFFPLLDAIFSSGGKVKRVPMKVLTGFTASEVSSEKQPLDILQCCVNLEKFQTLESGLECAADDYGLDLLSNIRHPIANSRICVNGIDVPLETQLLDLYCSMLSSDGWLYVTVTK